MNWITMNILAMAPPAGGGGSQSPAFPIVWIVLMIAIFYFMLIRPQKRKEKNRRDMIANVKSGERVVFGGGIIGTIANVKDKTFIIKIADKVKVEVTRGAVSNVLGKGEEPEEEPRK